MSKCLVMNNCVDFPGMTKVKVGKEDPSSAEFVERRRAALERCVTEDDNVSEMNHASSPSFYN